MMKNSVFILILLLFASCAPPTKEEALDYYGKIKFEIAYDILVRLDQQKLALNEFLSNPAKMASGPDARTYNSLLYEQKKIILKLKDCLAELENLDDLGDDAEYLENAITYFQTRLSLEETTMLRIIELLQNGMTSEESAFLFSKTSQLVNLQKQQEKFLSADASFLKEFGLTESDIEKERIKNGH